MVVKALTIVQQCYTAEDGATVAAFLRPRLLKGETVTLSFAGVADIPSSFANTAFASLLSEMSFESIRNQLKFVQANKQIADMIRRSFQSKLKRIQGENLS